MSSQPIVKPLGNNFLGHPVWPSKGKWYDKFWYRVRFRMPKGVRKAQYLPELKSELVQNLNHEHRFLNNNRNITLHLKCIDDLAWVIETFNDHLDHVTGPLDLEHLDGIEHQIEFLPKHKLWFGKHDTRLETKWSWGMSQAEINELRNTVHDLIKENLDADQVTVRGAGCPCPVYYVTWEQIHPILAFMKLTGVQFVITRAVVNDKYDETTPWRHHQWQ